MKNILLVIISCVALSVQAFEPNVYIGVKGASSFAFPVANTFNDSNSVNEFNTYAPGVATKKKIQPGFNVGVLAEYHFHKVVSVNFEVNYKQYNKFTSFAYFDTAKFQGRDTAVFHSHNSSLQMLNIPFYFKFYVGKKVQFYGLVGYNFGFVLGGKKEIGDAYYVDLNNDATAKIPYKRKDLLNATQFGVMGGAGLNVPIKEKVAVFSEFTGSYSISKFYNDRVDYFNISKKTRFYDFGIAVGVKMKL